jgi:putative transcriptional regulator
MEAGFLTGQLLIAMPGIGDPRFERAVLLVCVHDEERAMGLAVNRPMDGMTVPDILRRLEIESAGDAPQDPVMLGGPVQRERGFVLHTDDFQGEDTTEIAPGLSVTATREVLEAMARHNPQPRRALLALGYAGWSAGQLEDEIKANVWLTCDADEDLVFDDRHERKWAKALAKIGVDPERLSYASGRA